jgi:hypothetical protein
MAGIGSVWPGLTAALCTILIHALVINATVTLVRHEKRLGRAGASFWIDVVIVSIATSFAFVAHLAEIVVWAVFLTLGSVFPDFGTAYDYSAATYTTLGYCEAARMPSWRFLAPMEAVNGMLMFGVSTAIIFAVIASLIRARFVDLRD